MESAALDESVRLKSYVEKNSSLGMLADEDLVERVREGSSDAFTILAQRYLRAAYQTAYAMVGNKADAEDIVQESMVKAYRYIHTLKDPSKVGAWLRTIVRQEANGKLRIITRVGRLLKKLKSEQPPVLSTGEGKTHKRLYQQEAADYALQNLSERAREIVLLFYIEGLTCEEIALRTDLSIGAVKSHLFKARNKMQQALGNMGINSIEEIL